MRKRPILLTAILSVVLLLTAACAATDTGITTKVKSKLAADDVVRASEIEVTTHEYVVTLTGNVDSETAKARALELAKGTKGVVRVVDMIAVRTSEVTGNAPDGDRTLGDTVDDAGITMRVKGRLLDDPVVKGLNIDVDTRDGVVFLTGKVTSNTEREKAVQIARDTSGVRDVQSNLEIQS